MIKKFIGAAMVGIGIAGLVFAVQKNTNLFAKNQAGQQIYEVGPHKSFGNNLVSDRPFVEQLDEKSLKAAAVTKGENNLTEEFTKNLAEKIALENSGGLIQDGNQKAISVPDPNQIALDLLIEAQTKFDAQQILQNINDADIKITSENTKTSFISYTEKFDAITSEWRAKINGQDNQQEFTKENINEIVSAYENAIQKLYSLPVPKLLANMHKTEIKYLKAELLLFEMIQGAEKDPVGSLVASENFEKIDAEFNQKMNGEIQLFLKTASNL